jgi:hypothetical protein
MKIGFIGLGKMGFNMRQRLRDAGHEVVGYDRNPDVADVDSIEAMVAELPKPRVVWSMLPAGKITHDTVVDLSSRLESGDVIVEGGNSRWTDDMANAEMLDKLGIGYVDCGVSGGVWGLQNGYALMVGGTEENVATVQPLFDSLKPPGEFGFVHAGMAGAGHYAKMVHNGIEYGMMRRATSCSRPPGSSPTYRRSSRAGARAPSSSPGCSTSWIVPSTPIRHSTICAAGPRTPARVAGRWRRGSSTPSRCRCSPQPCSRASPPGSQTPRP